MGISTSASLIYGYHLQGTDESWLIKEIHDEDSDEYGLNLDWYDEEEHGDFETAAIERMLVAAGFDDSGYDEDRDDWRKRRKAAEAGLGVEFIRTGYEGGELILAVKEYEADLGDVKIVDLAELAALSDRAAGPESADGKLALALRALGITPLQAGPAWLLTAYRG